MIVNYNIPNAFAADLADAIAAKHNYNPLTDGTKADFAKTVQIRFWKDLVAAYKGDIAAKAVRAAEDAAAQAVAIT